MQGNLIIYIILIYFSKIYFSFLYLNYSVGKTSLLNRFIKNEFSLHYKESIGADFLTKVIERGHDTIQLQLWDTAGGEKYHSIASSFYRNTETCVLVFDLSNPDSYKNIEIWRNEFLKQLNPSEGDKFPFILLGNKSDLGNSSIAQEEVENYCKAHNNIPFFMTSAKDNINIDEAFNKIIDLTYERNSKNEDNFVPVNNIKITREEPKKKKKKCCKK